jgi:hypothetical protein
LKLFYFILFSLFISGLCAQHTVTGKVYEGEMPLPYFEVVLSDLNSKPLTSTLTNDEGVFLFTVKEGEYKIEGRLLGKIYFEREIPLKNDIDLGVIEVEVVQEMSEYVVTVRKDLIERKVDRLVFNVENSIAASGGDAIDALKATPGITVTNDQISMIGKSGMAVMVNDRIIHLRGEEVVNYLKTLSSDDIKKIEVITTPPAKYDAEGNSGLINIILKPGVSNSWSNSTRSSYVQKTYTSGILGNTFNYSKNKLNLRASVDGKIGNELVRERVDIGHPNQEWFTENNRKVFQDYVAADIMTDYSFSENSKLGFHYLHTTGKPDEITNYVGNIFLEGGREKILSDGNLNQKDINHSFNTHYYHTLDTLGRKIGIELDYINYNSEKVNALQSRNFDVNENKKSFMSGTNNGSQQINILSARIDIEHPTKWFDLSYGGKASTTKTNNLISSSFYTENDIPIINLNQSDNFIYTESTQALYLNGNKNLSDKWSVQLGLRYEFTQALGESVILAEENEFNYNQLFPTFYLQYELNNHNAFNINYSKRINRPAFWELNPFRWYTNEFVYAEGNPFLQPSFADNIELSHWFKNALGTTIFFQNNTNDFGQVPFVDENTLEQVYTRLNYFSSKNIGVAETYIFNKLEWWQSYNSVYAYYVHTDINQTKFPLVPFNGFSCHLSTNNSFVLNKAKSFLMELNFWYQAPLKAIIYDIDDYYSLDFGFRYFLFNQDLQISFMVNDILKTSFSDIRMTTNNIPTVSNIYNDNRYFKLSLIYKFGNKKINLNTKDSGLEEKGRI